VSLGEQRSGVPGQNAYYKLEDLVDNSGNGRNLSNSGSVTFVQGKFNNCANFGTTSMWLLRESLGIIPGSSAWTILFSLYFESQPSSGDALGLFLFANHGSYGMFHLSYANSSGTYKIIHRHCSSSDTNTSFTVPAEKWNRFAITSDASKNYKIYFNGNIIYSGTGGTYLSDSAWSCIGRSYSIVWRYGAKMIDDFGIYSIQMTDSQVRKDYARTKGLL
jgi:hypothetical protein